MTDKLELKSCHEVVYTVDVADVDSIFYCKPTDPDILTVLMKDGERLYCDEVCPIDSLQEEPVSEELEEACEQLAENARKYKAETSSPFFSQTDYKQGVIDGAKWQKEHLRTVGNRTISRAEKFIKDYTKNCSNLMQVPTLDDKGNIVPEAHPWLTPDQARRAVEIAREEVIEKVCEFLENDLCCYIKAQNFTIKHKRLENDLKQAIRDET